LKTILPKLKLLDENIAICFVSCYEKDLKIITIFCEILNKY